MAAMGDSRLQNYVDAGPHKVVTGSKLPSEISEAAPEIFRGWQIARVGGGFG